MTRRRARCQAAWRDLPGSRHGPADRRRGRLCGGSGLVQAVLAAEDEPPDPDRFPCLRLAYAALERGGAWPVVLNAANEMAVEAFLAGCITFSMIPHVIEQALGAADRSTSPPDSLADVRAADTWAREFSAETISTLPSS